MTQQANKLEIPILYGRWVEIGNTPEDGFTFWDSMPDGRDCLIFAWRPGTSEYRLGQNYGENPGDLRDPTNTQWPRTTGPKTWGGHYIGTVPLANERIPFVCHRSRRIWIGVASYVMKAFKTHWGLE